MLSTKILQDKSISRAHREINKQRLTQGENQNKMAPIKGTFRAERTLDCFQVYLYAFFSLWACQMLKTVEDEEIFDKVMFMFSLGSQGTIHILLNHNSDSLFCCMKNFPHQNMVNLVNNRANLGHDRLKMGNKIHAIV